MIKKHSSFVKVLFPTQLPSFPGGLILHLFQRSLSMCRLVHISGGFICPKQHMGSAFNRFNIDHELPIGIMHPFSVQESWALILNNMRVPSYLIADLQRIRIKSDVLTYFLHWIDC